MKKSIENFWYYYKYYLLVGVLIIFVAVLAIFFTGGSIPPDIQIGYVSDGREISDDAKNYINTYFEQVITDANGDNKKTLDIVPLIGPRVDVEFSDSGAQIVLVDGHTLDIYKMKGVFEPLDKVVSDYDIDISGNTQVKGMVEGKSEEHTYAIPVEKIKYLLDMGFPGEDYYLTVRVEYDNNEEAKTKNNNSYSVLDRMLKYKG